jgi:hypothetical protein
MAVPSRKRALDVSEPTLAKPLPSKDDLIFMCDTLIDFVAPGSCGDREYALDMFKQLRDASMTDCVDVLERIIRGDYHIDPWSGNPIDEKQDDGDLYDPREDVYTLIGMLSRLWAVKSKD